jgi:basic membrane protein A
MRSSFQLGLSPFERGYAMKKFIVALCLLLVFVLGISSVAAQEKAASDYRVALIIAQGGLGDRSYNDAGFAGLTLAAQQLGVQVTPIESPDPVGEAEQLLRSAAEAGFDLVITLEFSHFEPLARIAPDYPNTLFAIVNVEVDQPNVVSVLFHEEDGTYLAGMLAELVSTDPDFEQSNPDPTIGVIGGVQSSGIDVFLYGYLQGACAVNPNANVLMAYSNGFGDPDVGREMALAMHEQGADVVFQVAGGTGAGVIDAAKEQNFFAIGVDSDQDYLAPGNVLTSMMKRVDVAVYDLIDKLVKGELEGGTTLQYGLDVDGVSLTPMTYTRHLIPRDFTDQLDAAKAAIIDGSLSVIDIRELTADQFAILQNNATCAGLDELRAALASATPEATAAM